MSEFEFEFEFVSLSMERSVYASVCVLFRGVWQKSDRELVGA
jgi:hypothetical protein